MALKSYVRLAGRTQGKIEGPVTEYGRENSIEVFGWKHEVISPRDPASGMSTGRRQHKPLIITKPIDRTTPLLMKALVTNELITSFSLECWRLASDGTQEPYYRIELENAIISAIAAEQLDSQEPENLDRPIREHISFTYQKIIWTWLEGGTSTEDNLTKV